MSTRSVVAHVVGDTWEGVYCHWDGYPTWMGPQILKILKENCGGDVDVFVRDYIDAHPSGWSVFGENCYCHPQNSKDDTWNTRAAEDCDSRYKEGDELPGPYVFVLAPRV